MISKSITKICKTPELIENYDLAVADEKNLWECHHRRETIFSKKDLIEIGEYYNRPAAELIFLTNSEHQKKHFYHCKNPNPGMKGKHQSEYQKKRTSDALKGNKHALNKHPSLETKEKIRKSLSGKPLSDERRKKISMACKGFHYYNNGIIQICIKTPCPEGFKPGKLKKDLKNER